MISGAGKPERARQAMASTDRHLVREKDGIILLLTPPFDKMTPSPGYIQGYVPGVRENGGQYTHAALWTMLAHARLGNGDRAEALFRMVNPINHATDPESVERYRVEPYVVAADVYSQDRHVGRGGWTWYTGSAGWMYRVGVEAMLGVTPAPRRAAHRPVHPERLEGLRDDVPHRAPRSSGSRSRTPTACAAACGASRSMGVERPDLLIPLAGVDRHAPGAGRTGRRVSSR